MSGYTKLFASILESTIWAEPAPVKVVWITLLAMADREGYVEASVPGLARRAVVERGECERALAILSSPDPDSRTKAFEGRRIEEIEGGWRLLNYEAYRHRASADEAREKAAIRQRRKRDRDAKKPLQSVTPVTNHESNDIAEAEAEAEAEKQKLTSAHADFETFRTAYPTSRRTGGTTAHKAFTQARRKVDLDILLARLEQHKQSEQWQTPKLIPLMTTWLNQERWEQVLPEAGRQLHRKTQELVASTREFLR